MLLRPKTREEWLELRHKYVSSTESCALVGFPKYITPFELAVAKRAADPTELEQSERMTWGMRHEATIARGVQEDYGVVVRKLNAYAVVERARMGASFDYEIVGLVDGVDEAQLVDVSLRRMYQVAGAGILECKSVDYLIYRDQWSEGEAPSHIEIQVQHQLHCIERQWAAIAVLVAGNRCKLLIREYDPEVGAIIEGKVLKFWADIAKGINPPLTLPEDADLIRRIYGYAEPGKVLDASGRPELADLCREYADAALLEKTGANRKKTAQAQILQAIGDAERVANIPGFKVSAGVVSEALIPAYTRSPYRLLRVTAAKETA